MKKLTTVLLILGMLASCLPAPGAGEPAAAEQPAPAGILAGMTGQVLSFETTDADGHPVTSAELFRDNKITLVNVWGIWCPYCVDEMDELVQVHQRLQEKGCGVVGVEWEQKPIAGMREEIHAFLEEHGVTYPNVLMPEGNPYFDAVTGFPTTCFVDSEGRILDAPIVGALVDAYEPTLDRLLGSEGADTSAQAGAVKNDRGEYRVIVHDADGQPVEGAMIQLCDDTACVFRPTDAEGIAAFAAGEQKVYDVHVLKVPEGFMPDENVYKTLDTCSDVSISLKKAE